MNKETGILVFCLLAACAFPGGPQAEASETFGDITISPLAESSVQYTHGYVAHRVRIVNRSHSRPHRVRLKAPERSFLHGESIDQLTRTVVVGAGSEALVSLPQPPMALNGNNKIAVYVDGRKEGVVIMPGLSQTYARHYRRENQTRIFVSRTVKIDDLRLELGIEKKRRSGSSYRDESKHILVRAESETSEWPQNWLGYSCYDGVVISAHDKLPPAVWTALRRYVEAGGTLVIPGEFSLTKEWAEHEVFSATGMQVCYPGFGVCIILPSGKASGISAKQASRIKREWMRTLQPWNNVMETDVGGAQRDFRVMEELNVPVRGYFFIMLGFAIVIGPVNYALLAWRKRKIWLLWTVPALSLFACAAVYLYALLEEGITPRVRQGSLTLLDQSNQHAATMGQFACYCPLTPAEGLHFSHTTEVTPLVERDRYRGGGTVRSVDWSRDQHLKRGWVAARVPAHFVIRKAGPRRERLVVNDETDKGLSALNGLGSPIEKMWISNKDGRIYSAEQVEPGAGFVAAPAPDLGAASADALTWRRMYGRKGLWKGTYSSVTNKPAAFLRPSSYIAVLAENPFMEEGLQGRKELEGRAVVVGFLKETEE
ncbi:MAG: hypothetical protein ACOCVH_00765 [Verrucomicrobiota bacterium]